MDEIGINSRRRLLQNLALTIPIFGLASKANTDWEDKSSLYERRERLAAEFSIRPVSDLADILADIVLRIESLEKD